MRIWPVHGNLSIGDTAIIEGADARHLLNVLRLESGDVILVGDESSKTFRGKIGDIFKNRVSVSIMQEAAENALREPHIYLAVGISKPQVMELAVQKAVELGCAGFFQLATRRSAETSPAKIDRLKRIMREACKQCGRAEPMDISDSVSLKDLPKADIKIALWEEETEQNLKTALGKVLIKPSSVLLAVGPAGGFTPDEAEMLKDNGFVTAGFGPLILRTETAAISLVAVVNQHFGRFEI